MTHGPSTGRHMIEAGERFIGHTLAVVLGVVMIVSGMGMGVTMVLLPIGVPLGTMGLLLVLWGVFYSSPARGGEADHGHGHGHGASH